MVATSFNSLAAFAAFHAAPTLAEIKEAWGDPIFDRPGGSYDELDRGNFGGAFGGSGIILQDRREDRARGEDWPRFRTEHDLARIRGVGRFFGDSSAFGIGALGRLGNYTFGTGFTFKAQAETGVKVADELLAAVQRVVDAFTSRNTFNGGLDRELDRRARRDGEALLCLDLVDGWQCEARFAEPAQLTEPANPRALEEYAAERCGYYCDDFAPCWSFGVISRDGRHDKAYGYHFVWNSTGSEWDCYPEARVCHIRRNVDSNVKRGVSDFQAIPEFIAASEKLLRNTQGGAAIQAAIPFVKEFVESVTKDQVRDIKTTNATSRTVSTPLGAREIAQQYFAPGTIPHIRGSKFVDGPGGDSRVTGFVAALQASFRYLGTRWDMPEGMISGDASNANYASSIVAESPFVKAREADQLVYAGEFRKLLWKAIRIAYDGGFFNSFRLAFSELQAAIFIKIDPPSVAARDKLKEAQTDAIYVDKGAMAVATMATRAGLDHKAEVDAGAKPAAVNPFGGAMPGNPLSPASPSTAEPGALPTPGATPSAPQLPTPTEPTAALKLNGAQITSAAEILSGVRSGNVAAFAAEELLVGVGIDRQAAQAMIAATNKLPDPQPEQPIAGPLAPVKESTAPRNPWCDYPFSKKS